MEKLMAIYKSLSPEMKERVYRTARAQLRVDPGLLESIIIFFRDLWKPGRKSLSWKLSGR